jgi:hypothetical protein
MSTPRSGEVIRSEKSIVVRDNALRLSRPRFR